LSGVLQLSGDVQECAGFLCNKAAVFG